MTRSQQMLGFDSNYVPGWDCHGLPIEWKIEEENTAPRARTRTTVPAMIEFRRECRAYAEHWLGVQRAEFKRLGVVGDWDASLYDDGLLRRGADRARADEVRRQRTLYRGSKPVMWSVVEKTALAEAEVEYEDYTSDTVWVKFPDLARRRVKRIGAAQGRLRRHLDDDAVDDPGQPRDQLFAEDQIRPLSR